MICVITYLFFLPPHTNIHVRIYMCVYIQCMVCVCILCILKTNLKQRGKKILLFHALMPFFNCKKVFFCSLKKTNSISVCVRKIKRHHRHPYYRRKSEARRPSSQYTAAATIGLWWTARNFLLIFFLVEKWRLQPSTTTSDNKTKKCTTNRRLLATHTHLISTCPSDN